MTHTPNPLDPATHIECGPVLDSITLDDYQYDPWGVAASWAFAICSLAYTRGIDIPDEWEYSPGAMGPAREEWADEELDDMDLTDRELIDAGYQVIKWCDAIRDAGRDY